MAVTPTDFQTAQANLVQLEIAEAMTRMRSEGIDPTLIIAGTAAAIGTAIEQQWGPEKVAPWFANQAAMINGLKG